ncbi:hypothetical protein Thermo_01170 [Thermoplasmatales archaeon]|nr:hypothetical protein Thermo_01170 [Thermoplasmatales archaeon]
MATIAGTEHNRPVDFREQPLPVMPRDGKPSPVGQRHMLYNPRCYHRIPQATLGLTRASQDVLPCAMTERNIRVPQFLSTLKAGASLRRDRDAFPYTIHLVRGPSAEASLSNEHRSFTKPRFIHSLALGSFEHD